MTTNTNACYAAQVRAAQLDGQPQPFTRVADVTRFFEPTMSYADLFEDSSVLFYTPAQEGGFRLSYWSPETVQTHEDWAMMSDILEAWKIAKEDA